MASKRGSRDNVSPLLDKKSSKTLPFNRSRRLSITTGPFNKTSAPAAPKNKVSFGNIKDASQPGSKVQVADPAASLLLKLAGMAQPEKKCAADKSPSKAEGCDDLQGEEVSPFRELFDMLDQSNTGIITADNLYEELRKIDNEITFTEVEDVLKKVDKDGNGEIDFEEFLFHMTNMVDDEEDEEKKNKLKKRQERLFSAITVYLLKQTLVELDKTLNSRHAPHVLSHYTAGARLIGLTTRQLERELKRMQKSTSKIDSPYAAKLRLKDFGLTRSKLSPQKKRIPPKAPVVQQPAVLEKDLQPDTVDVTNLSQQIENSLKLLAEKHSVSKSLPDPKVILALKQKIGSMSAHLKEGAATNPPELISDTTGTAEAVAAPEQSKQTGYTKRAGRSKGWTTPGMMYLHVPTPRLKLDNRLRPTTFANIGNIRKIARAETESYYRNLRQQEIINAQKHWKKMNMDGLSQITNKLGTDFGEVFRAYSPHCEADALVICPSSAASFPLIRHPNTTNSRMLPFENIYGGSHSKPSSTIRYSTPIKIGCRSDTRVAKPSRFNKASSKDTSIPRF